MLISWTQFVPEETARNKLLCTQVVNTLVKYAADKAKIIFNTNICKTLIELTPPRDYWGSRASMEETDRAQQGHARHDGEYGR